MADHGADGIKAGAPADAPCVTTATDPPSVGGEAHPVGPSKRGIPMCHAPSVIYILSVWMQGDKVVPDTPSSRGAPKDRIIGGLVSIQRTRLRARDSDHSDCSCSVASEVLASTSIPVAGRKQGPQ
eukprot:1080658-Amphidinium_carterae.1